MALYAHVTEGAIDEGPGQLPRSWRNISGLYRATAAHLKSLGWLPYLRVGYDYDAATQVRAGPVEVIGADDITATYTLRDKTAQELAADQRASDLSVLREGGKNIALVLVELVDWLLANTAIQPTDFTSTVRQAYTDLKIIADRIKNE